MADAELLSEAARLAARGEPFVLATVVRREAPSSAWPGCKAIVRRDGSLRGWLGGACIEPTVVREAVRSLRDGRPRLVLFSPDAAGEGPGDGVASPAAPSASGARGRSADGRAARHTAVYPMTCHSGGTIEVYIDPQRPSPALLLFGESPVTRALAGMGAAAGYAVRTAHESDAASAAGPAPDPGRAGAQEGTGYGTDGGAGRELFAVVATMGEWDEDAVERALATGASYVGLVSSPRRAERLRALLRERGVDPGSLGRLRSPAGMDLGAREPGEIAVTIMAEIVRVRHEREARESTGDARPAGADDGVDPGTASDPVCGMTVRREDARHVARHDGTTYYFCCPSCRERFLGDPAAYAAA